MLDLTGSGSLGSSGWKEKIMAKRCFLFRFLCLLCLCVCLCAQLYPPAYAAFASTTLHNGSEGEEVRQLQQALIDLGFLKGTADGKFGTNTENAVRAFQRKNKLTVDGLAGTATKSLILSQAEAKQNPQSTAAPSVSSPEPTSTPAPAAQTDSSLFGTYTTIRKGQKGERVKALQQALITLGYLKGSADGIFGNATLKAVKAFQKAKKLTADGIAGKKTLTAIQNALSGDSSAAEVQTAAPADPTPAQSETESGLNPKISGPSGSSVQLLHWFNDVKPSVSNGQHLLVYDPATGYSWTLRILARGRHCDAEPLTKQDTDTMVAAFGGVNTWNQKAVYVRLPDGRWSLASTHDMPHDSGTISDNGFNGHLCVHFLRDMDEAKKNDPNYGVSNQETIRQYWKKLTGQEIEN